MAENVAILGLGTMGAGMAANLLKAGFSLSVYNRTAAKAKALIDVGRAFAVDAGGGSQRRIDHHQYAGRRRGIARSLAGQRRRARCRRKGRNPDRIEHSKSRMDRWSSPDWLRSAELDFLDAPVTGSRMQAEAGQLSFLVGGRDAAIGKSHTGVEGDEQRDHSSGPGGKRSKDEADQQFSVRSAGRVAGRGTHVDRAQRARSGEGAHRA